LSLYVDSSALLKRYIDEPDSAAAAESLESDPDLVTGRHTVVEVRRNLARLLRPAELSRVKRTFSADLESFGIVELDAATCELAATIAETTGVRSLDALHLGAAQRVGGTGIGFLTFDLRQAQAARALGFSVVGA
jgi:predicted nucleic acid-binding protein